MVTGSWLSDGDNFLVDSLPSMPIKITIRGPAGEGTWTKGMPYGSMFKITPSSAAMVQGSGCIPLDTGFLLLPDPDVNVAGAWSYWEAHLQE